MHDGFRKSSIPQIEARFDTGDFEAAYALAQEAAGSRAGRPRASRALAAILMARDARVRAARAHGISARVQRDGCGLAGAWAYAADRTSGFRSVCPSCAWSSTDMRRLLRTVGGGGLVFDGPGCQSARRPY